MRSSLYACALPVRPVRTYSKTAYTLQASANASTNHSWGLRFLV